MTIESAGPSRRKTIRYGAGGSTSTMIPWLLCLPSRWPRFGVICRSC